MELYTMLLCFSQSFRNFQVSSFTTLVSILMMARIQRYDFGKIVVNGTRYERDVIVADRVIRSSWWRREGHKLYLEDIADVLEEYRPDILVVGTGYYGYLRVQRDLLEYARDKGIEIIAKPTSEAVEIFNNLSRRGVKVLGAFHLTC